VIKKKETLVFPLKSCLLLLITLAFAGCGHGAKKSEPTKYSGLGLESVSSENLRKYAPPAAVPALKKDIEKLVDIRVPSAGMISNDGKMLFVDWTVTGTSQIWRLDGAKSFPIQLTGGEDRGQLAGVSPDGQWILVARDSKADENHGIYLLRAQGGPLQKVFYNPKNQASVEFFTADSKSLYFRVNDKTPSSYAIYKYNIQTDLTEPLWEEPGIWSLGNHDENYAILTREIGSMQNEHFLLNLKTKKSEPIIGQNETEDFDVLLTDIPGEYIVATNKISDFRRIYLLKNKELKEVTPDFKADVSSMVISKNKKFLAFTINSRGYSIAKLMNLKTKKITDLPVSGPAEQMMLGSFSANSRFLTFATDHHNEPRRNYVLDLNTNKTTQWLVPSTPEISTKNYLRGELLSYTAEDGTEIPMFVWRSEKCKKEACPVIVSFHGGPESQFTPKFNAINNYYTENDFIFVAPNVRGSDGYGKTWLQADNGAARLKVITDIRDCAEFIKKNWKVGDQVRKIGIMGGSYGGYSTLVGMSKFSSSYDAGVAIVGMSNLITFIENTAPYRRALRMNEYGDPSKDRAVMEQLSPVSYVSQVKNPLLIMHGATDPRVPVGEALQFFETIQTQNPSSRLVIFPDEGHGVSKRPNVVLLHSYALDFFKTHLK
jgi:dipeptidyl aminopeptidase/acylaminoacyl peptidase